MSIRFTPRIHFGFTFALPLLRLQNRDSPTSKTHLNPACSPVFPSSLPSHLLPLFTLPHCFDSIYEPTSHLPLTDSVSPGCPRRIIAPNCKPDGAIHNTTCRPRCGDEPIEVAHDRPEHPDKALDLPFQPGFKLDKDIFSFGRQSPLHPLARWRCCRVYSSANVSDRELLQRIAVASLIQIDSAPFSSRPSLSSGS